ncbi:oxidoreductase [Armatimonadota bacterium]|nr:oxidoreductase [Armatimonadota bacterium]
MRVAVIGCGFIGRRHAEAIRQSPYAELVATCDIDITRAEAIAGASARAYADYVALLQKEKPDVVTIATPDHLHVEPTLQALRAGCHVFCEKPLAMTLEEARLMAGTAAECGRFLAVDYNRRFSFGYGKAHQLVLEGRIGDVTHAMFRVTDGIPPFVKGRGAYAFLFSMLTHHIDLVRWFCGEIVSVYALQSRPDEEGKFLDTALSFEFASGAIGSIVGGWREGQTRTIEALEVGGTQGAVLIEDVQKRVRLHGLSPDSVEEFQPDYFWGIQTEFYHSLDTHVLSFLERTHKGEPPLVSGWDGVRGLEIVAGAIESHRLGCRVRL